MFLVHKTDIFFYVFTHPHKKKMSSVMSCLRGALKKRTVQMTFSVLNAFNIVKAVSMIAAALLVNTTQLGMYSPSKYTVAHLLAVNM
jgi:hypothetical protein